MEYWEKSNEFFKRFGHQRLSFKLADHHWSSADLTVESLSQAIEDRIRARFRDENILAEYHRDAEAKQSYPECKSGIMGSQRYCLMEAQAIILRNWITGTDKIAPKCVLPCKYGVGPPKVEASINFMSPECEHKDINGRHYASGGHHGHNSAPYTHCPLCGIKL